MSVEEREKKMTCLKEAEILHGMCDFPFFLREKIRKHQGDVIVGWNCILSLKYSHFPCPLQWQITEEARRPCSMRLRGIWALGRSSSRSVLWKWLKSRLRACLRCGKFSSPVPSVRCKCKGKQRGPKFKSKGGNKTKDHGYMCKSRQSRVVYMHIDSLNMHIKLAEVNVFQTEIAEIYSSLQSWMGKESLLCITITDTDTITHGPVFLYTVVVPDTYRFTQEYTVWPYNALNQRDGADKLLSIWSPNGPRDPHSLCNRICLE